MKEIAQTVDGSLETSMSSAKTPTSKTPTSNGLLGQTIDGRYRVESLLGEGGMGLVYRVTHTRLNRRLAMKVLRPQNTSDPEVLVRFRREAESASAIGNQHIVDISDFGELGDGSTYFTMECLDGVDLIDAIDDVERMPEERALRIAIQICSALGAAHDAGITHRDLKPENVFLIERDGTEDFVKVLDFGIAKVSNAPDRLTRDGAVLGTPHYMSPEQCEGRGVDHRTDIYAVGILLYEMVTGYVPYDADTMVGILTKHMHEKPVPPRKRGSQISAGLERLVMRCLEKRPEDRYQTMNDLATDLELLRSELRPATTKARLGAAGLPRLWFWRMRPLYLGAMVLALLAFLGTITVNAFTKPEPGVADNETRQKQAAPEPSPPAPPVQAPMLAPLMDSDVAQESSEAKASEPTPDAPVTSAKATPRKKVSGTRRRRPKPSPKQDRSFLDPWN
jgi:serine/threonine protein kinase